MRSTGQLVNRSSWCDDPDRALTPAENARCKQMLSAIPSKLESVNKGLSTLQFWSLSVSPHNKNFLQGGTQDNGTWENRGDHVTWRNTMIGDGGQSGFDVGDPKFRFHTFFDATPEVNFNNGDIEDWISIFDPIFGHAGSQFYSPVISDPVVSKTMFAGTGRTVYRTKTAGLGNRTLEEANRICNSFFGTFEDVCGDWVELGPDPPDGRRSGATAGRWRRRRDRADEGQHSRRGRRRPPAGCSSPATSTPPTRPRSRGRASTTTSPSTPNRFVSSIYVDPTNGNRAWVSYSGFNVSTPAHAGSRVRGRSSTRRPGRRPGWTCPATSTTCRSPISSATT